MTYWQTHELEFIRQNLQADPTRLLLQSNTSLPRRKELIRQIAARQKARHKLPGWYAEPDLRFPPALSVEQASSEQTAAYKASLVGRPACLVDLTGGMGVDALAFARVADRVIYVEQQPELAELARYNLPLLGGTNVEIRAGNALEVLRQYPGTADWVYVDPARRDDRGGRVFRLEDCEPNVADPDTLRLLLTKAHRVLLKTSPLIDIDSVRHTLPYVEQTQVVAVDNEVKEVLFMLSENLVADGPIKAVNLRTGPSESHFFSFRRSDESAASIRFGDPQRYLYEPNASILKAGAFRSVADRFGLTKLAPNTHLYTSVELAVDFPGRAFDIRAVVKTDRKTVQALLPESKANVSVRNFPEPAEALRKKLGLSDGGDWYLFGTTLTDGSRRLILTQKSGAS